MQIYTLPSDLQLSTNTKVLIHDYSTHVMHDKSMVDLELNTLSFLQEGTKEVFTSDSPVVIDNSSFLLMKAGRCLMTEKLSPSKYYRSLLVFFSDELLEDILVANQLNPPEGQSGSPVVAFKYDSFMKHFVATLVTMTHFTGAVRTNLLRAKLTELLVYLHATQKDALHCFIRSRKANHDRKMIHVVESNSLNKLNLSELAFLSNMSVSTFKRSFEKHFGTSPIKWFQQKRLEHAAYLLGIKGQRASDVYLDAGYENLSNFIQAFKTKYGVTPKQYQEQC